MTLKPMSDDELDLLCEKALFGRVSYQQLARSVEQHHGIGLPSPAWCASVDAELAATAEADAALSATQVQAVRDAVAEALGDAYDCTRAWSAWGVGTMDQDDFQMVAEDGDRVAEIADAAIAAMRASAPEVTLPATAVAEGAQLDGESLEQAS